MLENCGTVSFSNSFFETFILYWPTYFSLHFLKQNYWPCRRTFHKNVVYLQFSMFCAVCVEKSVIFNLCFMWFVVVCIVHDNFYSTMHLLTKLNATVSSLLPTGTTVIWVTWFYCFCGNLLDTYWEHHWRCVMEF